MAFDLVVLVGREPAEDLIAAERVEIHARIGEPTTYRLRYGLSPQDEDYPLLRDARVNAGSELTLAATIADAPVVLVQGQVYGQLVHLESGVRNSWVEVIGGDSTMAMDREVKSRVWTDVTVSDVVSTILSDYGMTPQVDPIATTHTAETHALVQCETDLRFVRRLAARYGHWFHVATDAAGIVTAHFQRPVLAGTPVATLDLGTAHPTVDSIDLEWDVERPATAVAQQLGLRDLGAIAGDVVRSPLPALGAIAFADVAPPRGVRVVAPADSSGDLQARGEASLIEGGWFIRARGRTTVRALGATLHPHTLVQLANAGARHSGTYVVASVQHVLDAAGHTMHFELIRNGWEA